MLAYLVAPMLAYMPSLLAYITSMLTPLKAVISAIHHWFSVFRGRQVLITMDNNPFSLLVASSSGSSYVATSSEHSSQSQAHPRLFECDSRPLISTQSADNDRVESPIRDLDPIL